MLSSYEDYDNLIVRCYVFKQIDIYEIYCNHTHKIIEQALSEVKNDFALLSSDQLLDICRAYQTAYYESFEICASIPNKDIARELLAENIDLFYTLITEIGMNLQGTARCLLDKSIANTCVAINRFRTKFTSNTTRAMWKKADLYWKHND